METENSRTGRQSINNNLPLLSQDEFVLTGFTHTPNFNKNNTNCMNNLTISPQEKLGFMRKRSSKKSYYSAKGLRILMILGLLLFSISMFGQYSDGDFKSRATGVWNTASTWSIYDSSQLPGNEWVNATTYPGQVGGSYDVFIEGGYTVTINSNIPNYFNSLNIGDGIGGTDNLFVGGNSSLILTSIYLFNGGFMSWTGNNINLDIPTGSIFIIEAGGTMDTTVPCNATKTMTIGSTSFASCIGGSSPYSFTELMNSGGNVSFIDTDGDGILNGSDLDDDNDGIPDEDEGVCAVNNGDVELPLLSDNTITWSATYDGGSIRTTLDTNVPFWTTTASDSMIEIWSNSNTISSPHADAYSGNQFMELNANQVASSYQDILTIPNSTVSWTIAHRARSGTNNATVSIGAPGSVAVVQAMSTGTAWVVYSGTYLVPAGQTTTRFQFDAVGGGSSGNFLDSFILSCPSIDTDNDGVPNYLDLDSDNDGIFDIDESGVLNNGATDSNRDGRIDGSSFGSNGLFNSVESDDTITANITYTISESLDDSDILPNFTDLDSDGDGIPDNVEAQSTLGYVAPSGLDTDSNGIDDAYDSNGTPIALVNSDGTDNFDYLDTDSDNEGGNDTAEAGFTLSGADVDGDGLDDNYDADITGYSDPGGTIDDPLTGVVILPNTDGLGDVDFRDPEFRADLELTKTVQFIGGIPAQVEFTITVTNNGPDDATGVTVLDNLPSGFNYDSDNGGGAYNSGTGIWTIGTIASGNSASLVVTVELDIIGGGLNLNNYVNAAEVRTSDIADLDSTPGNGKNLEDDYDEASFIPINLSISKATNATEQCVGEQIIFTVVVTNDTFFIPASNVVVTDLLPTGYTYDSHTVSQGTYVPGTGVWTVGGINGRPAIWSCGFRDFDHCGNRKCNR